MSVGRGGKPAVTHHHPVARGHVNVPALVQSESIRNRGIHVRKYAPVEEGLCRPIWRDIEGVPVVLPASARTRRERKTHAHSRRLHRIKP